MNTKVTYRVITPDGELFTHTEIEAQWYRLHKGYEYEILIADKVITVKNNNYEIKDLQS